VIGGPLRSSGGPRYGVAPNATLLIAKVTESINGDVRSDDFTKIRALLWAAGKGAHVASISLGTLPATDCEKFSPIFEFIAGLLRDLFGTIIVAACGNGNNRLQPNVQLAPIFHHADCPAIIAVAAVGRDAKVARNSCGSICGQRNPSLAAPGDGIRSAFPTTISAITPFASFEGTSSATPHVAGVAALWVERTRGRVRGQALQNCVMSKLKSLSDTVDAVGNGLVLAPTATDSF
jgi:subtilisin family serine protease